MIIKLFVLLQAHYMYYVGLNQQKYILITGSKISLHMLSENVLKLNRGDSLGQTTLKFYLKLPLWDLSPQAPERRTDDLHLFAEHSTFFPLTA